MHFFLTELVVHRVGAGNHCRIDLGNHFSAAGRHDGRHDRVEFPVRHEDRSTPAAGSRFREKMTGKRKVPRKRGNAADGTLHPESGEERNRCALREAAEHNAVPGDPLSFNFINQLRDALRALADAPSILILINAAPRNVIPSAKRITRMHGHFTHRRIGENKSADGTVETQNFIRERRKVRVVHAHAVEPHDCKFRVAARARTHDKQIPRVEGGLGRRSFRRRLLL